MRIRLALLVIRQVSAHNLQRVIQQEAQRHLEQHRLRRRTDQVPEREHIGDLVENRAWFKNARFRVTSRLSGRTPIVPALERVYAISWFAWRSAALISRKPGVSQKFQPVGVPATCQ